MQTTPTAITLFPDRARVTRTGHTTLATGLQRLEVSDLPLSLLADSVRAAGRGTAKAKLLGVSTRLENFVETPAETVRELENKIQALEDTDHGWLGKIAVIEKEQQHLDGLAAQSKMFARGLAQGKRTPEEQGAIFSFISDRRYALQTDLIKANRERHTLAKELDRLRRDLNAARSSAPRQRYVASVELEVLETGEFDLELTYVVVGASWKPLYDLRLVEGDLTLTYLAQVQQNTGEEWPDVALTLSTAQPALSLVIPELPPWYIHQAIPLMRAKRGPAPLSAAADETLSFGIAPAPMQAMQEQPRLKHEMMVETATVSDAGPSLTYQLSARANIPGNNDPRKVNVAVFNLKPRFDYVSAPKAERVCYRRAKVKNDSPYSLLSGEAQLFEKGDYLGATHLDFIAPNQEFELTLGADERLRIERELTQREVDKTFIGDKRRIRYGYRIEVENLRDTPQTVFVRDQLPVSQDEQIKVKLELADPKPTEHTDLNQLEWQLTLERGVKKVIRFEFVVEHPRTMDVVRLP